MAETPSEEKEVWRDVPGWKGFYAASNLGQVKSVERTVPHGDRMQPIHEKIIKQHRARQTGYLFVVLVRGRKQTNKLVHRLVLETFAGPCPEGMQCRHLDGSRTNNTLANLAWGTRSENQADRVGHGTHQLGEQNTQVKLDATRVRKLRRLHATGKITYTQLGQLFGIHRCAASLIVRRKRWSHVS